ncbi:MAG: DMT family transporter [Egibacteraceae bacterium]
MPAPTARTRRRDRMSGAAARRPLALIATGVLLYSTGPVFVAASDASGPVFSFWRLWIGVPALGLLTALHVRAGGRWPDRRAWRWAGWAGLAFGVHQLLMFTAIKATSVVDVSLMNTLAPIVVAVAAVPLFGERPGWRFRAWTVLAMAGAAAVVLGASAGPEGNPVGMAMALGNVITFGAFFLLSKLGREHIDVLPFLFGVMTVAALSVSAFVVLTGEPVATISGRDLGLAAATGLGPGILGHFVMTWPLRWVPANVPPVMRLAQPVLSGLLAWWLLAEPITGVHLLGGALTLAGVGGAILSRPATPAASPGAPAVAPDPG